MTQYSTTADQPLVNRSLLLAGAALLATAALLGLAGSGLAGAATVIGLRRHVRESGLAPSEVAMHHWRRVKTAANTGVNSWRAQPLGASPVPAPRQPARQPTGTPVT